MFINYDLLSASIKIKFPDVISMKLTQPLGDAANSFQCMHN